MSQNNMKNLRRTNESTVSEDQCDGLLPIVPKDIALLIATLLPWRDICTLSGVNTAWRQAIQDHQVYSKRVLLDSTETILVMGTICTYTAEYTVSIHSRRGVNCRYELPPVPGMSRGIPMFSQLVPLSGKIYILGGTYATWYHSGSTRVYVLDLAAGLHSCWRQCASMHKPRLDFGVGVLHGKIFAIGGISDDLFRECEVYDPEVDTWTQIKPTLRLHSYGEAFAMDNELLAVGFGEDTTDSSSDDEDEDDDKVADPKEMETDFLATYDGTIPPGQISSAIKGAECWEAYNPVKDSWRIVEHSEIENLNDGKISLLGAMHFCNRASDEVIRVWAMNL